MRFSMDADHLRIDQLPPVDLAQAAIWQPHPIGWLPSRAARLRGREALLRRLRSPQSKGLAPALSRLIDPGQSIRPSASSRVEELVLEHAAPILKTVLEGCTAGNLTQVLEAGLRLIGLGPGLTPSGDDFMGGLLFTWFQWNTARPDEARLNTAPVEEFLARARGLTNPISTTILADLAEGQGPEPLHDLMSALWQGAAQEQVLSAAYRLTRIGHTSGWDMLAGVSAGLLPADTLTSG
jgi:hypothetical protein